ncbi:extracellular solute-binding protein [Paracoccus sp. IB05]|uniref:extracellular solute-binding protein n=1 Tax=Paracoccus sp. IB05 TaxID=2779367 RepID=UPI0018E8E75F|nr:extracellular solute-binding protein [Paracoccus sp. IB05]MBJ2153049.1 extracellular solute-binding protein [Paracoccus sp. IB05]
MKSTPLAALLTAALVPAAFADPVLYTSNPVPAYEAVQAAVREQAGASLGVITGGSGVLLRRVEAEAPAPQADVFWSSSANTLGAYEGLFEPYASPALEAMLPELRYPGDLFLPANLHVVTMLVNTDQLDGQAAPQTWADLADPAWNGRIILADPANSSTGYTIVWGLSKLLDEATYKAVVSNMVVSGSSSNVPRGVAMGEYTVGLTYETNSYAYIDGGQTELLLVYPADGTFTSPEYAALIRNAPAGEAAKATIDALLSKDAQIALLKVAFRRPSRTDITVADHVGLPEISDIRTFALDEAEAAANRDAFLADWAALPKAGDVE